MSVEEGAETICQAIQIALHQKTGLLVGRNGTIELETLFYKREKNPQEDYPYFLQYPIERNAGVWPSTADSLSAWAKELEQSIRSADILVQGWYAPLKDKEQKLLASLGVKASAIPLRSLEPYYVPPEKRWTSLLKGQRVAVVSSFTKTIANQLENRELVWPLETETLLPGTVDWALVQTGYSPKLAKGRADWPAGIHSWRDAVAYVVAQVLETGSRIALIGCGGLGMLIAHELKQHGIIAIVLGGALQVLFGIKGNRWKNHAVISQLWNEDWVYPLEEETPRGAEEIEGGCYWGKN